MSGVDGAATCPACDGPLRWEGGTYDGYLALRCPGCGRLVWPTGEQLVAHSLRRRLTVNPGRGRCR